MSLILLHFDLLGVLFAHLNAEFVVFLIPIVIDIHLEFLILVVFEISLPEILLVAMALWLQQVLVCDNILS